MVVGGSVLPPMREMAVDESMRAAMDRHTTFATEVRQEDRQVHRLQGIRRFIFAELFSAELGQGQNLIDANEERRERALICAVSHTPSAERVA